MATFAERLKQLREERNLGQEELGAELGVSKNTVYRWEANRQQPKEEHVLFLSNFMKHAFPGWKPAIAGGKRTEN